MMVTKIKLIVFLVNRPILQLEHGIEQLEDARPNLRFLLLAELLRIRRVEHVLALCPDFVHQRVEADQGLDFVNMRSRGLENVQQSFGVFNVRFAGTYEVDRLVR